MSGLKHKKIKKQKGEKISPECEGKIRQPLGEQVNLQSSLLYESNLGMEQESLALKPQFSDKLNAPKFKLGTGWAFILQVGKCYRITNISNNTEIIIIDGIIDLNGKWYTQIFPLNRQLTLTVQPPFLSQQNQDQKQESPQKYWINLNRIHKKGEYYEVNDIPELANYNKGRNALVWNEPGSVEIIELVGRKEPWANLEPMNFLGKGETTMLIGMKNTGKSMFCQYLLNRAERSKSGICILDLDMGRNMTFPACVSLTALEPGGRTKKISLWIGEYSPLNSIPNYVKAMSELFGYYKQKYFTSGLIVNTMGYLTGIGELAVYEAYNIIKPQKILAMSSGNQEQWPLEQVIKFLRTGNYLERLHFKTDIVSGRTSTSVQKFINQYAEPKPSAERFEVFISAQPVRSIWDLFSLIIGRSLVQLKPPIQIYHHANSVFTQVSLSKLSTSMRLVLLGKFWRTHLFQVCGVSYGWDGELYYDESITDLSEIEVGLVSDGVDFEKSFYQISETNLLQMQESVGKNISYIQPSFKVLGSKGIRNNPGKKIQL